MPHRRDSARSLPGGLVHRARGRGLEAADIRPFVEGDDLRLIDRNATARSGQMQVRATHDERDQTVLLMADFRPPMLWGTRRALRSVAAAEALALVGWRTIEAGARVALFIASDAAPVVRAAGGRATDMVAIIGALAEAHDDAVSRLSAGRESTPPLDTALRLARNAVPRAARVILASSLDDEGAEFEAAIRALHHRAPVTVLRIADAFERAAPRGRYLFRRPDGEVSSARAEGAMMMSDRTLERLRRWGIDAAVLEAARPPEAQIADIGALDALSRG